MSDATTVSSGLDRRRWLILGVIGIAQLGSGREQA